MAKAFIALNANTVTPVLQNVFSAFPAVLPRLVIDGVGAFVDVPDNLIPQVANFPGLAAISSGPIASLNLFAPNARPWLQAWNRLFDPNFIDIIANRPANWLINPKPCSQAVSGFSPLPQTMTMVGNVAVGVLIVDGPIGSTAQITPMDDLDIALALAQGLDILFRNAPPSAKLIFVAEVRRVTLSVQPSQVPLYTGPFPPTFAEQESRESKWRDPALQALGFLGGFDGINAYRGNLVARQWPGPGGIVTAQKSIVWLITKYNTANFAYAALGRVVFQLTNARGAVGSEDLDRVIAHETCHLFDAPDEYGSCNHLEVHGPFLAPNVNCVNNPIATIRSSCLMFGDSDNMCGWTKAHVGWAPFP
jgi:hypothetical protein